MTVWPGRPGKSNDIKHVSFTVCKYLISTVCGCGFFRIFAKKLLILAKFNFVDYGLYDYMTSHGGVKLNSIYLFADSKIFLYSTRRESGVTMNELGTAVIIGYNTMILLTFHSVNLLVSISDFQLILHSYTMFYF